MGDEVKEKYYVVWAGKEPGIYTNWDQCKAQVEGFNGAKFKKFTSLSEANAAYEKGAPASLNIFSARKNPSVSTENIISNALAVDAACSGNPGKMEFRGVWVATGKEAFRFGPFEKGTNNIGEFLALVYGIGLVLKTNPEMVIYSDSENAISWVKQGKCKTKLAECDKNKEIFELIRKSEAWLKNPRPEVKIYKWNTKEWGEIPADFGRK